MFCFQDRGALSILDASFKVRVGVVPGEPSSTVRMEQEHLEESCLLLSDWSLHWLDVCISSDASENGFAVREGCRELEADTVQEEFQVRPSPVTCAPLLSPGVVWEC